MSLEVQERERLLAKAYDWRLMKRLWRYVVPHWRRLSLVLLLIPLASGAALVQPYLLKLAIDEHVAVGKLEGLAQLAFVFIASLLVQLLSTFAELYQLQALGVRAMNALRRTVFAKVQRLPLNTFNRVPLGRLMTRMTNDIENITEMFAGGVVTMLADFVTLTGIVVMMLWINWRLALIAFAVVPFLAVLVALFRVRAREAFRLTRMRVSQINAFLQENLSGMPVVQAFVRERHNQQVFAKMNGDYRDANFMAIRYDALLYSVVEMVGAVAVAGVLWFAAGEIAGGLMSFGVLVAFIEYIQKFFIPIRDLSAKYTVMQSAMASAERVFELLDSEEVVSEGKKRAPKLKQAIRFQDLSFAYRAGDPVLRGVNFTVHRGERVALVGHTGSGKSSLVSLLLRLYELEGPDAAGQILIDGENIASLSLSELRLHFAIVLQDAFLFRGSFRDNLCVGLRTDGESPEVSEGQIEAAVRAAHLGGLLQSREGGLDSLIEERGSNLSAGERQLVAFARALLRDPEVLILDEATANVDSETEHLLQEAVESALTDRTAIVIAHRLSTIEQADRVIVLHKGRVVEQGTHQALLAAGGYYSRLYELQYRGRAVA